MPSKQISDVVNWVSTNRTYVSLDAFSMHHLVNVVRCDSRFEFSRGCIEDFSSQPTDFSHTLLLLLVQTNNGISRSVCVFRVATFSFRIVWMFNRVWHRSSIR